MQQAPPSRATGSRPPLAFLGAVGIVLVILTGLVVNLVAHGEPFAFDQLWHDFMAAARSPFADLVAVTLNVVGGTLAMTLITAAVVILLFLMRRYRAAIALGLTVALASAICSLLKVAVGRPRPVDAIVEVTSDAFPSGHTTTAAAFAIALALLVPRVWVWVLASVWIVAMGLSRTYLLVHWLSDVAAGAVLGASVAMLVFGAALWVVNSRRFLKEPSLESVPLQG